MLVLANEMFDSPPVFAWVLPVFVRLKPGKEETFFSVSRSRIFCFFHVVDRRERFTNHRRTSIANHILSNVLKLQDKKCISAYLFSIGLDDQDPSQWDDADLSHLVVPDADYPSDSEEEGEEEEEEEEDQRGEGGGSAPTVSCLVVPDPVLASDSEEEEGEEEEEEEEEETQKRSRR